MNAQQRAKREFIAAYFDDAVARIAFLDELNATGHEREAMTLCLTYIDSFAQWLCWPKVGSGHNFVDAIIEFGGDEVMGLAHPPQAVRAFDDKGWKALAEAVERGFPGPPYELLPLVVFEQGVAQQLTKADQETLGRQKWRATVANTAYQHLRRRCMVSARVVASCSRRRRTRAARCRRSDSRSYGDAFVGWWLRLDVVRRPTASGSATTRSSGCSGSTGQPDE